MDSQQLATQIMGLPEPARLAVEQLIRLLGQQVPGPKLPPILRPAAPLTEEEKAAEQYATGGWADRTDIVDGAEYIHQVRRGLRQP